MPGPRRSTRLYSTENGDTTTENGDTMDLTNNTAIQKNLKTKAGKAKKTPKSIKTQSTDSDAKIPATKSRVKKNGTNKNEVVAPAENDSRTEAIESPVPKSPVNKRRTKKKDTEGVSAAKKERGTAKRSKGENASKEEASAKRAKRLVESTEETTESKSPRKKGKTDHQRVTERDPLPKLWNPDQADSSSFTFKIASWNVAGLRALMRNNPSALSDLVKKHDLDLLCLQETKLQDSHLDDPKLKIRGHLLENEGYDAYYSCSTAKKGYSGTAVFVKRRGAKKKTIGSYFTPKIEETVDKAPLAIDVANLIPQTVSYKIGKEEHDAEGRIINVDFPLFSLANVYVPNSGQNLDRLSYRTESWDRDLLDFMQKRQTERGLPVIWLGDLNVAHTGMEVWNDGAKHLSKQAGVTPEERASFSRQLDAGFIDAFRKLHPTAKGQYTYWSQRAGNREPNKGLRLDYFICSTSLFNDNERVVVRDSYILQEQEGSDHCPVVLEIEIQN